MTKRFISLFVFSGVVSFSMNTYGSLHDVAKHFVDDISQAFCDAKAGVCDIASTFATDAKQALERGEITDNKSIELDVSICEHDEHGSSTKYFKSTASTSSDALQAPKVIMQGVKFLASSIKPEQAAEMVIMIYKEVSDNQLKTLPEIIKNASFSGDSDATMMLFGQLMNAMADDITGKQLDLAVAQHALPKEVYLELQESIIKFSQESLMLLQAVQYPSWGEGACSEDVCSYDMESCIVDQHALAAFMADIINGTFHVVVSTLAKHYPVDYKKLGLDSSALLSRVPDLYNEQGMRMLPLEKSPEDVDPKKA